ncbi:aliphatic amidase expression-regulating protein [Pelomyxa schiedti]|nr:aliphatic amidase expression-regulating protein [Pelomyxa schiedti]
MSGVSPTEQVVRIGVVVPLSGGEELFGSQGLQGVQLAVEELNTGRNSSGLRYEIVVHDEKTNDAVASKLTEKVIVEDNVIAVVGPTSSKDRNAMMAVCEKLHTPLLYGTDYEGGCYSRYLFCYSPIPAHYVDPLVPYLKETYPPLPGQRSGFFLLGTDYVWPKQIFVSFKAKMAELDINYTESLLPFPVVNWEPIINDILASNCQVVVVCLIGTDGQNFLTAFAKRNIPRSIQICVMAFNENYMNGLPPECVEGVITCTHFLSTLNQPETKDFVARSQRMFPSSVTSYMVESHYGLIKLLDSAIRRTGNSLDKERIIDAFGDQDIVVGNGHVFMRKEDHHMILNMVIAEVKNGVLVVTKNIGQVVPPLQNGL